MAWEVGKQKHCDTFVLEIIKRWQSQNLPQKPTYPIHLRFWAIEKRLLHSVRGHLGYHPKWSNNKLIRFTLLTILRFFKCETDLLQHVVLAYTFLHERDTDFSQFNLSTSTSALSSVCWRNSLRKCKNLTFISYTRTKLRNFIQNSNILTNPLEHNSLCSKGLHRELWNINASANLRFSNRKTCVQSAL